MTIQDVPMLFILAGLVAYVVLAGAVVWILRRLAGAEVAA